jgi:hypothetical protein
MSKVAPPLPPRRHEENTVDLNNSTSADGPHSEEKSLDDESPASVAPAEAEHTTFLHTDGVSNPDADFGEWEENLPVSPVGDKVENASLIAELATNTDNDLESTHVNEHCMDDGQSPEDPQSDLIEQDSAQTEKPEIQAEHEMDAGLGEPIPCTDDTSGNKTAPISGEPTTSQT